MTSVFKLEVNESIEELKELLKTQTLASKRDRVRALYLYQTGKAKSRRHLASLLGCAESTIYRWFKTYQQEGLEGLLLVKTSPGRPRKIQSQALKDLLPTAENSNGFWLLRGEPNLASSAASTRTSLFNGSWHSPISLTK